MAPRLSVTVTVKAVLAPAVRVTAGHVTTLPTPSAPESLALTKVAFAGTIVESNEDLMENPRWLNLDMYGKGKLAKHPEDAQAFMAEATKDPAVLKARFLAALDLLITGI